MKTIVLLILAGCLGYALRTPTVHAEGYARIFQVNTHTEFGNADLRSTQGEHIAGDVRGFACYGDGYCFVVVQ